MGELGPLAAPQAPHPGPTSGRGGPPRGLPPPPAPPLAAPTAPAAGTPAPAVQLAVAGLELEAWLWPNAAGGGASDGTTALRGPARIVPLPGPAPQGPAGPPGSPGAGTPAAGSPGAWVATVLGPAVADGLLARAGDALLWLPGPRPGLPPGARLLVSWRSPPELASGRPPDPAPEAVPPAPGAAPAPLVAPGAPIRAGPAAAPPLASDATPVQPDGPPRTDPPAVPPGGAPAPATAPPEATPVAAAAVGLARLLGLAARPIGEEDGGGGGEAGSAEQGRSRLEIDFPELGRVRLELAWSRRGVELRLAGPAGLSGEERAGLVRAFADGLELGGARGRVLVLGGPAGRPVAWTAAGPRC